MKWPRNSALHLPLLTFVSSLVARSPQSTNANPNNVEFSKARQSIQEQMVKWSIPSISVAVARVSGQSYSNFLRTEILWPLGMTHASVGIGPGLEKFVAQRYITTRGLQPPIGGGLYCSAHDLARFGMFCLKTRLPDQKRI